MDFKFYFYSDSISEACPKRIFEGHITKVRIKASDFNAFIDGKEVKFFGEYFLENEFILTFDGKREIEIDLNVIGTNTKLSNPHSGYILIEYIPKEYRLLIGSVKITKFKKLSLKR